MTKKKLTPMMQQYQSIKQEYPGAILWFRLGDFYEMFHEDAKVASQILGITLTARGKGENAIPMCGVPYHAAENYLSKLTKAGKNVAICEQLTEATATAGQAGKGIVERGVVKVVTPGTTLSDVVLADKGNNYIAAIVMVSENYALAVCDITTGEFQVTSIEKGKLYEELTRLDPAEIVISEGSELRMILENHTSDAVISDYSTFMDPYETLISHFKVQNLEGYGLKTGEHDMQISAAGMLLSYLLETQKTDLMHIQSLRQYSIDQYMALDETTIRNLELLYTLRDCSVEGSLVNVIDRTTTSMGTRMLRNWLLHPLLSKEKIEFRLDGVEECYKNETLRTELVEVLKSIRDIERLLARISLNSCSPRDISALNESLKKVPELGSWLSEVQAGILNVINSKLADHSELTNLLDACLEPELPVTLKDGGVIANGYDEELDELRKISTGGKDMLLEIAAREQERTGISSLKVKFNNVFGYYIEVSNANKDLVPEDYIRKQTLTNAERYITPELKELEEKILGAQEKIVAIEKRLFEQIRQRVVQDVAEIQRTAKAIAMLDVLLSFAKTSREHSYVKPELTEESTLEIIDGRHPVIETLTHENRFVPNDAYLSSSENYIKLITGPNMAGKSTYLRQVALITLLAHIGSYVPATRAKVSLTDRIFTRVGASDNLTRGQSTFMVEMQEAANILNNATDKSLIILDEIGRGTSTYDGVSIAWAILEYVHDALKAKTLFATHYHELISVADKLNNACNWSVQVVEKKVEGSEPGIAFLYKVKPGAVNRSYGIEVGKLAGLPKDVIVRANDILKNLEEGVVEKGIRKALKSGRVPENQQDLFTPSTAEVSVQIPEYLERTKQALSEIDPLNMTPIQALQKLEELKKMQDNN